MKTYTAPAVEVIKLTAMQAIADDQVDGRGSLVGRG